MRVYLLLATTALLSACGGGGGVGTGGPTSVGASPPPTSSTHSFVDPTEAKTYSAIGGTESYSYQTSSRRGSSSQTSQLYQGDATTARNSGLSVAYSPRDGIFEVQLHDGLGGVDQDIRYQDPLHRTDFNGAITPQDGVPDLANGIQYLQAGTQTGTPDQPGFSSNVSTFFYQKPGTSTKYVTFAGFVRNTLSIASETDPNTQEEFKRYSYTRERGAFAYGELTPNNAVPTSGTGTYSGAMLASMIAVPGLDDNPTKSSYFQWLNGSATTTVDFGASTFKIDLSGTASVAALDQHTNGQYSIQPGATFAASGAGTIDLVHAGGFLGDFDSASFTQPNGTKADLTIAGSSVDGAFYGPHGEEVGGGFRIVGGKPDERIDIVGAFTGAKPQ